MLFNIFLINQFATIRFKVHLRIISPSLAPVLCGALVKDGFLDKFESRFIIIVYRSRS